MCCRPETAAVLCVCCSQHCVPAAKTSAGLPHARSMCLTAFLHPCCSSHSSHEELRCVLAVVRHGDRTPKQKMKMKVTQVGNCSAVRGRLCMLLLHLHVCRSPSLA